MRLYLSIITAMAFFTASFSRYVLYSRNETIKTRTASGKTLRLCLKYPSSHPSPFHPAPIIHIWRLRSEEIKGGIALGREIEMMSLRPGMIWPDLECGCRMPGLQWHLIGEFRVFVFWALSLVSFVLFRQLRVNLLVHAQTFHA
jgi:hypothetical protein